MAETLTQWLEGLFHPAPGPSGPAAAPPVSGGVVAQAPRVPAPAVTIGAPENVGDFAPGIIGRSIAPPAAAPLGNAPILGVTAGYVDPVWPPPIGSVAGNSLGFLHALPRDPGQAILVPLGGPCYALTLDPQWTAPNALVGVMLHQGGSGRGAAFVMRPGDTQQLGGIDRIWIFAADGVDLYGYGASAWPLGYCRFLAARAPGIVPTFVTRQPAGLAAVIAAGLYPSAGVSATFAPGQIRAVRVSGMFVTAAGAATAQGNAEIWLSQYSPGKVVAGAYAPVDGTETPDAPGYIAGSFLPLVRRAVASPAAPSVLSAGVFSVVLPVPTGSRPCQLNFRSIVGWGANPAVAVVAAIEGVAEITDPDGQVEESVLYDVTAAAAAENNTPVLPTEGYDSVTAEYNGGAAGTQLTANAVQDDGTSLHSSAVPAAAAAAMEWGLGTSGGANAVPYPVPRWMSFGVPALAGQTVRLVVKGYRKEQRG